MRLLVKITLGLGLIAAIAVAVLQFLALQAISEARSENHPGIAIEPTQGETPGSPTPVVFVGNNWQGTVTVIDGSDYRVLGVINGVPDKAERLDEIEGDFMHRLWFYGIRELVGEGNNQYVDDMYSSLDGRLLVVSRPSFADVVAIDLQSGEIEWRFEVDGPRSDHMAISPDGTQVAVSASLGNVVHVLDIETGQEIGRFPTGDSPHENVYSKDGTKIYNASIGRVFSPLDFRSGGWLKGERRFQSVDTTSFEILEQFDMRDKLDAAGFSRLSPAIRPMTHTADERLFYFQLSFLHGFIEYDMQAGRILRRIDLPKTTTSSRLEYVNDSAHHGIAISGDDRKLCVAGTMDDYVAIVDIQTERVQLLTDLGEKPYWVVTDRSGELCYVSWSATDQISLIHYRDARELHRIDVGRHPQRIREGFLSAANGSVLSARSNGG